VLPHELRSGGDGMSRLLTVEEVASLLNVPQKWVYRRVGLRPPDGIPYLKVGKYLRFRESDLWEYIERLRRN
jgi:excisionase family DNA binding protein